MAICLGKLPNFCLLYSGGYGHPTLDVLRTQCSDCMGKRVFPTVSCGGWLVPTRRASLHGPGDDRSAGFTPDAGGDRRSLQGTKGTELLVWYSDDGRNLGSFTHRIPPSLGPKRLLGHCRGYQPDGRSPTHWNGITEDRGGRLGIRTSYTHPVLRPSCRCSACYSNRFGCCSYLSVPKARYPCKGTKTQA